MNEHAIRALLLSLHLRILKTERATAHLLDILYTTDRRISESRNAIRRSDRLIESLYRTGGDR